MRKVRLLLVAIFGVRFIMVGMEVVVPLVTSRMLDAAAKGKGGAIEKVMEGERRTETESQRQSCDPVEEWDVVDIHSPSQANSCDSVPKYRSASRPGVLIQHTPLRGWRMLRADVSQGERLRW